MFCSCLCLSFGILLGAEERHFYLVGNSTEKYKNIPFSSKWWEIPLVATPCRCPQQFELAQDRPLEFLLPKIRKSQWPLTSRPRIMTFRMTSPIEGLSHGTICIMIGYKMAWQYPNLRSHAKLYFCRLKYSRFVFGSFGNFSISRNAKRQPKLGSSEMELACGYSSNDQRQHLQVWAQKSKEPILASISSPKNLSLQMWCHWFCWVWNNLLMNFQHL